ncbi:MAG TPA: hypothetical protein VNC22_16070, partial [Sporichthya sp.]|nr:hypothetical protein [Sporichthya sp.]
GTATSVPLFSDNGTSSLANPFSNDINGSFEFYAQNGRVDIIPSRSGVTFTAADWADVLLYDPRDDANQASHWLMEALTCFTSGSDRIVDGHRLVATGLVAIRAATTTYKTGWLDVLETGGVAGSVILADGAGAIHAPWVVSADLLILEQRLEKIGDAVAGTRRCGLTSANFSAGDPANGIYIRQIDANNAFAVCRAASTETTLTLGQTLNNITVVRFQISTGQVRVAVDLVDKGTITTNVPTVNLGWSAGGGATASAAGLTLDYVQVVATR